MAVVVEFIGPVEPLAVPSDVKDKWKDTLLLRRELIYSRLLTKIPDEDSFISRIAEPSHEAWKAFVSTEWPDYYLVTLKQNIKLSVAFGKWQPAVIDAFQPGGRFENGVQLKVDRLDMLKYTLGNVGVRYLGWGPGYKAVGAITGDLRISRYIEADETLNGTPVNAFPEDVVNFVRPTLIAMLTQGAVLAYYAHEKGLNALRDQVITIVNSKTDSICTSLKKAEYTVVYARLEVNPDTGKLQVHSRVEA